MSLMQWYSNTSSYYRSSAYQSNLRVWDTLIGKIATVLFVSNILFMTRSYALSNVVETLLFGLFLFTPSLRDAFLKTLRDPLVLPLILFFAWALLSGLWGHGSMLERLDDWWGWRKLLLLPIGLVLLSDPRVLKASLIMALAVGLLFFGLALTAWGLDMGVIWGRRYTSVLQNHNSQGIYFAMMATVLLVMARNPEEQLWIRVLKWALALGLIGFTVGLGSSRSGYVASAIAIVVVGMFWIRSKKAGFIVAAIAAVSLLLASPFANQRIQQAMSEMAVGAAEDGGQMSSGGIRVVMWKNTLGVIADHWLVGTGAGGFDEAYLVEVEGESGWRATGSEDPHSHYLHIWAEYGLVGLGLFLWFLFAVLCRCDLRSLWGAALFAALGISCAVGVFDGVFGSAINGRIFILAFTLFLIASSTQFRFRSAKSA